MNVHGRNTAPTRTFVHRLDRTNFMCVGVYFPASLFIFAQCLFLKLFLGVASRFLYASSCALSLYVSLALSLVLSQYDLFLVLERSSLSSPVSLANGSALLDLKHEVPIA